MARVCDDPRCRELRKYLRDKNYIYTPNAVAIAKSWACTKTPDWNDYISPKNSCRLREYINERFKREVSDPVSVAIYAAMMDTTCEEVAQMFLQRR